MKLLTPGPVQVPKGVLDAMARAIDFHSRCSVLTIISNRLVLVEINGLQSLPNSSA
jgi:aspartate aminotransferase-like enzyme